MAVAKQDLTLQRGDTSPLITGTVLLDGVAVDITGATLWFTVKTAVTVADNTASLALSTSLGGVAILVAASGTFTISITATQMAALAAGATSATYVYDVQYKALAGQIYTLVQGSLTVPGDVTLATS